jgi:hypothetical protein
MAIIPTWLLGRHVTAFTAAGVTVAADGTLTTSASSAGNPQNLAGFIDAIDFTASNTTENIQSIDQRRANYVITESETSFTLTEILKTNDSAGAVKNIFAALSLTYDYALITLTRGGRTWAFTGVIGSYTENINKGKSTGKIELKMVDSGGSNPTLT